MPIQDPVEMALSLAKLLDRVADEDYYPALFTAAFGDETITVERITLALAQFVRALVSVNSKYDEGRLLEENPLRDFPNFSDQENLGKQLFMRAGERGVTCVRCHITDAFLSPFLVNNPDASTSALNNGLVAESTTDLGVAETTGRVRDEGKFKTPSLRNIAVRPPYMHDGRFASLDEVIEHYSSGIQDHPNLAGVLRDNETAAPIQFNFTDEEKAALLSFLNTLTDPAFLNDEKFSDPFE